ncbi:MAG: ABC transporter permease [Firmicutes bacterium]|nr:ABC transporter permease [Bacillota bacterium]
MFTIAKLTFTEAARKKVFLVTILLSIGFVMLYGMALDKTAEDMARLKAMGSSQPVIQQMIGSQLLGAGLYFASLLVSLLALMASIGSVAPEIENGLLHAVVSKPIKRSSIILGKYFGLAVMLAVYATGMLGIILLINKYYYPSSLSYLTAGGVISGTLIFILQPLVLLAVAMLFSTLFRALTAGIIATTLYGLGMVGGFIEQIGSMMEKSSLVNIGIVSSLIMPSDALYRKLVAVVTNVEGNPLNIMNIGPFGVSTPPSSAMLVYACIYAITCLGLAVYSFNKKDL